MTCCCSLSEPGPTKNGFRPKDLVQFPPLCVEGVLLDIVLDKHGYAHRLQTLLLQLPSGKNCNSRAGLKFWHVQLVALFREEITFWEAGRHSVGLVQIVSRPGLESHENKNISTPRKEVFRSLLSWSGFWRMLKRIENANISKHY